MNKITNNFPNTIVVTWKFTTTCNFACNYCPPSLHDGKYGFPDFDASLNFLKSLTKNNKTVYVDLLGGETTLWPKLINFLTEIKNFSKDIVIQISTNGSRTNNWWKRFYSSDVEMNSYLHFTYHPELINEDLFYKNLEIISEKYFTVCSFMLDTRHIDKTILFFEKVKANLPVDCAYKLVRPMFDAGIDKNYTDKDLEKITANKNKFLFDRKKYPKKSNIIGESLPTNIFLNGEKKNFGQMLINKENNFYKWKCMAGQNRLIINEDGSIFPCHPLVGNDNFHLGNININSSFKFLDDYINCPVSYCSCILDASIDKFKENE